MGDSDRPPAGSTRVFELLDELGIEHETVEHEAVYTVEQAEEHRDGIAGASVKNLFVRDKKRRFWLLVAPASKPVDLKQLRRRIGASGNLSFGSAAHLQRLLHVEPGAVTPLAVVNDRSGEVTVLIDRDLLEHRRLAVHPLRCDMTTTLATDDLFRFLEAVDHPATVLDE